jgi:hypothetical protein
MKQRPQIPRTVRYMSDTNSERVSDDIRTFWLAALAAVVAVIAVAYFKMG